MATEKYLRRQGRSCNVEGCERPLKSRDYCNLHWNRVKLHGDPGMGKAEARLAAAPKSACLLCGTTILKVHHRQAFCSEWCQKRHRAGLPHKAACVCCGQAFVPRDGRRYCSTDCRKNKRRVESAAYKAQARATDEGKRRHIAANRRYVEANRAKVNGAVRARRDRDPDFRMAIWMRTVLHRVLSRANLRKSARCVDLLGYDRQELRLHIERQFHGGMGWHNHGEWHIDHIIPIAEHIRRGQHDPMVVNALTNLRPMWGADNIRKSDRVLTLL